MPKGAIREKTAATKMTPRRPSQSFKGSDIQPALAAAVSSHGGEVAGHRRTRGRW